VAPWVGLILGGLLAGLVALIDSLPAGAERWRTGLEGARRWRPVRRDLSASAAMRSGGRA
jgi:hypothetical protein